MEIKAQLMLALIFILKPESTLSINHDDENIIVSTKLGQIKGSTMKTRLGKTIYAFRGIYYAEPPVGELRFKPPVPIKPWKCVLDATQEGPACPQANAVNMSENCLTLNIYIKQLPNRNCFPNEILPVIFYLHTGGYLQGTSQSFLYGPEYLLDDDVVLVTTNYRLASLGFLSTGDHRAPGNMGLKDQVAAMRFVRDHIDRFGGDPNSVTLTGQSAGSRSIVLHMLSPMSRGLFHRAIGQSGTQILKIPLPREQKNVAIKQAELLNCSTKDLDEMMECLRKKPAEDFGKTVNDFLEWYEEPLLPWYPSVEPKIEGVENFMPADPEELVKARKIYQVPVIFGVTKDEYISRIVDRIIEASEGNDTYFQELNNNWDELAPLVLQYESGTNCSHYISHQIRQFYFNDTQITVNNSDVLGGLLANALAHFPIYRTLSLFSEFSSATFYFYEFTYDGRYCNAVKASKKPQGKVLHGDELQYIFPAKKSANGKEHYFPFYTDNDPEILVVKRFTSIWTNFAKTGKPIPKNSDLFENIIWEKFTPESKFYLDIGQNITLKSDFLPNIIKFWSTLFP